MTQQGSSVIGCIKDSLFALFAKKAKDDDCNLVISDFSFVFSRSLSRSFDSIQPVSSITRINICSFKYIKILFFVSPWSFKYVKHQTIAHYLVVKN